MKTSLILFALSIFSFNLTHAQVGLLSTNNKSVVSSKTDTAALKLPDIGQISYQLKTTPADSLLTMNYSSLDSIRGVLSMFKQNYYEQHIDYETVKRNPKISKKIIKKKQTRLNNTSDSIAKTAQQLINDSLLIHLVQTDFATKKEGFINKLNLLLLARDSLAKSINKSDYLTRHFPIDTAKKTVKIESLNNEMSDIYASLEMLNSKNSLSQNTLRASKDNVKRFSLTSNISVANSAEVNKNANSFWKTVADDTMQFIDDYKIDTTAYNKIKTSYNDILKKNIADKQKKEETKQTDFGAFPQLTTILGKKEVIPQLQLYGSYLTENSSQSFEANLGISFAPSNNPDTANIYTIFIPTASKFLVHSNFTWSFLPVGTSNNDSAKKVGFRLDVSFASKNLLYDTTKSNKTITSSLLYARAGIELGVIPKRLSLYGNINTATVLDKVDEFQSGTGVHSKFLGYLDCGARLYFDPTPAAKVSDGLFIYSNLNFIINSGDVKRVTKSNDTVIPSIQVGIVKTLGKF